MWTSSCPRIEEDRLRACAALITQLVEVSGFGRVLAVGIAAFFVGIVTYSVAGKIRVPPLVVAVPAIVPFLPGLSIYRGLTWLAGGGSLVSQGILALMTAMSVAIALASGVILGEYVAQPLKREARRTEIASDWGVHILCSTHDPGPSEDAVPSRYSRGDADSAAPRRG